MRLFATFIKLEFKRLLTARNVAVGLLFSCAAVYFIINGVGYFKDIMRGKEYFKAIEQQKVVNHVTSNQQRALGFETTFMPSPLSVFFFNSGAFSRASAAVNMSVDLKIYRPLKGRDVFLERDGIYSDYGGFLLFFGSLLLLFYGSETLRHGEYLKSLTCLGSRGRVYTGLIAARFLLISLFFAVLTAVGAGVAMLGGIEFTSADMHRMVYFFVVWELVAFFFFITGTAAGAWKSKRMGGAVVLVPWIFLIFIIPTAFNKILSIQSSDIPSNYRLEKEKLDTTRNFDKWEASAEMEKALEIRVRETTNLYHSLAVSWPSTFYGSLIHELGGAGFENYIEFSKHARELKHKLFIYKNKKFQPGGGAVPFIEEAEYLFYGESRLPPYFLPGILVMLGYCLVFTLVSYWLFKRSLLFIPGTDIKPYAAVDLELKKGEFKVLETNHRLADLLFSVFSGASAGLAEKGFSGRIRLDRTELTAATGNNALEFLYIPSDRFFPGEVMVEDFISLCAALVGWPPAKTKELLGLPAVRAIRCKRFNRLEGVQRGLVPLVLSRMKETSIYLFFDTALKMPHRFAVEFLDRMEELAKDGSAVVYVTTDSDLSAHGNQGKEGCAFTENPFWAKAVEVLRETFD